MVSQEPSSGYGNRLLKEKHYNHNNVFSFRFFHLFIPIIDQGVDDNTMLLIEIDIILSHRLILSLCFIILQSRHFCDNRKVVGYQDTLTIIPISNT